MVAVLLLTALLAGAQAQVSWDGNRLRATCQQAHGPTSDCVVLIRATVDRYHDFIATHCARQSVPFSRVVESDRGPGGKPIHPQHACGPVDPEEHWQDGWMSAGSRLGFR
jgi:hypothetical protein